jgi:hypothetical protein
MRVTAAELGLDSSVWEVRDLWTAHSGHIADGVIRASVKPAR